MNKKFWIFSVLSLFALSTTAFSQTSSTVNWTVVGDTNQGPNYASQNTPPAVQAAENKSYDVDFTYGDLDKSMLEMVIQPAKDMGTEPAIPQGQLELDDILNYARVSHTPSKAAEENINLSKRRVLVALRNLFPEVEYEVIYRDGSLSGSAFTSRGQKVTITQPIFRGGTLWNTFLEEKKVLEAAQKSYDQVFQELTQDIALAYFEFQRAKSVVKDYQRIQEKVAPFRDLSQKKFDAGIVSEIENLNVDSIFSQLEFDYEGAKQELELAKLEMERFIGSDNPAFFNTKDLYDQDEMVSIYPEEDEDISALDIIRGTKQGIMGAPDLNRLVDMAYGNRAELHVELAELQSAQLAEKVEWGGLLPTADLTIEFGKLGEAFTDTPGPILRDGSFSGVDDPKGRNEFRVLMEMNWNLGGNSVDYSYERDESAPSVTQFQSGQGSVTKTNTLSLGLLDGLDAFVDIKQAELDRLNAVVELEDAETRVIQEVKQAYYDYQKALIQMKSAIKRVKWRERLRNLSEHRLGTREVEISEYLQAEIDLHQQVMELHNALKDYYSSESSLNYAIGVEDFLKLGERYE